MATFSSAIFATNMLVGLLAAVRQHEQYKKQKTSIFIEIIRIIIIEIFLKFNS